MILLKPPLQLTQDQIDTGNITIFLAGSIEMGKAEDWQSEIQNILQDSSVTIFSPRRDDWNCVDSETKAITNNGIKSYNEIKEDDLILTYNTELDILEYQPILKLNIHKVQNSSNVARFKRNNDYFYFTNNHKHIDRAKGKHKTCIFKDTMSYVGNEGIVRTPTGKLLINEEIDNNLIPEGTSFKQEHIQLAAWILSEGSIFNDNNKRMITISQYINCNYDNVIRIKNILDTLEMKYRYYNNQFILHKDAVDFILGYMKLEKYKIPQWIKNSSVDNKRLFITEYGLGDGCYNEEKLIYIAYSEKYLKFAEEFQILAYESGWSTKMRGKTSGFGHPVVNINFHDIDKKGYSYKYDAHCEDYNGVVWCPTTENKTWVAYRNGSPFITGNSSWPQDANFAPFNEQVTWELDHIDQADMVLMYFDPDTKSPITLLELGILSANPEKVLVCCPQGYWRKGNVDIVCQRYGIPQLETKDEFFDFVKILADEFSNIPSIDVNPPDDIIEPAT